MTLGIIDVGTNSIHLVIGILGLNGRFHIVRKERELARLGAGGLASRRLTAASMRRGQKVLARYAAILARYPVDRIDAVATSAVREASNGRAFVRRIRARLGLPLRIISGREEARLIYLGILQSAGVRRSTLMISLGGGSAEVMVGDARGLRLAMHRPLGCARLAEEFIHHDPPRADELQALERLVRRAWAPVARAVKRHRWQEVIGTSATIQQVLTAAHAFTHGGSVRPRQPAGVSRSSLARLVQWLATSTAGERTRLPGLDPRRQDLALTTGVALLRWMEGCGAERIRHAPGSLREGLVVQYLIRHHQRRSRQPFDAVTDLVGGGGNGELTGAWRKRIMRRMRGKP